MADPLFLTTLRRMFRCAFGKHRWTVDTNYCMIAARCIDCHCTNVVGIVIYTGTNKVTPKRRKR
jgi:hypothetical protein